MKDKFIYFLLILYWSIFIIGVLYIIKMLLIEPKFIIEKKTKIMEEKELEIFSFFVGKLLSHTYNIKIIHSLLKKKGININETKILEDKKFFQNKFFDFLRYILVEVISINFYFQKKIPFLKLYSFGFTIKTDLFQKIRIFYRHYLNYQIIKNKLYKEIITFYLIYSFKNKSLDLEVINLIQTLVSQSNWSDYDKILIDYLFFEYNKSGL